MADAWAAVNVGGRIALGVDLAPVADQAGGVDQEVGLQLDAYTTNADASLTYQAEGLPDGLSVSRGGLISGAAATLGTGDVTVTVTDSRGATASDTFSWQVAYGYSDATRVDIPGNGAAVESAVTVTGRDGNASAATAVDVDIVHTCPGDLTVDLVGPDGTVHSLPNRSGGPADDVDQTFTVDAFAQPVNGTWKLRVQDRASIDVGHIARWTLTP